MLRRITSTVAYQSNTQSAIVFPISRRFYGKATATPPKLDPLSEPFPGELDPRFGDLPPWNVPVINRQNLTETPAQPYFDQQARRYYSEPVHPNSLFVVLLTYQI